jgi:hypothetical protein
MPVATTCMRMHHWMMIAESSLDGLLDALNQAHNSLEHC